LAEALGPCQSRAVLAPGIKAILFDVFGTVVDWRTCVIAAFQDIAGTRGTGVDWGVLADEWRTEGYLVPIGEIVGGSRPYADVEARLGATLDVLLSRHRIDLAPAEVDSLRSVWRRLDPWPDARAGLERLADDYVLGPLSNGSFALLTEMAKRAGLPWDCIVSTELFSAYKPDPRTYEGAARLLGLAPTEVMLVAAHVGDLRAAASAGLRTGYVPRPLEWGTGGRAPAPPDPDFDVVAEDFGALADHLCRSDANG
jgi:2-haloacid dehalogenase